MINSRIQLSVVVAGLLLIGLFVSETNAASAKTLVVGQLQALPGTAISGSLEIPAAADAGTFIPVTLINGVEGGPVLSLIAGIHGTEYTPVLAMQKLRSHFDPGQMSGAVIIVHAANIPAFQNRTEQINPVDRKNLYCAFPGSATGTLSERMAYTLTEEIIRPSDYILDIQSGESSERVISHICYIMQTPDATIGEKSARMAHVFGIEHIWGIRYAEFNPEEATHFCDYAAVQLGKPTVRIEAGERGNRDENTMAQIVAGILNVVRDLKIVPGEVKALRHPLHVLQHDHVESDNSGIFYPLVKIGAPVSKDAKVGYITDYFGNTLSELHAPISGIVMQVLDTPPVNVGDNVLSIAKVD